MRVYTDCQKTELAKVVCNCCRRELSLQNGILQEECIHVEHIQNSIIILCKEFQ